MYISKFLSEFHKFSPFFLHFVTISRPPFDTDYGDTFVIELLFGLEVSANRRCIYFVYEVDLIVVIPGRMNTEPIRKQKYIQ